MSQSMTCPRCEEREFTPYGVPRTFSDPPPPALSRAADVYICSACGSDEAIMDFAGTPLPLVSEWPINPTQWVLEMNERITQEL